MIINCRRKNCERKEITGYQINQLWIPFLWSKYKQWLPELKNYNLFVWCTKCDREGNRKGVKFLSHVRRSQYIMPKEIKSYFIYAI
jgi:hypothetical protein